MLFTTFLLVTSKRFNNVKQQKVLDPSFFPEERLQNLIKKIVIYDYCSTHSRLNIDRKESLYLPLSKISMEPKRIELNKNLSTIYNFYKTSKGKCATYVLACRNRISL